MRQSSSNLGELEEKEGVQEKLLEQIKDKHNNLDSSKER